MPTRRARYYRTFVLSNRKLVLGLFTQQGKVLVLGVSPVSERVLQIDSEPGISESGQSVYLVQAQPVLSIDVSKTVLIARPPLVKVH